MIELRGIGLLTGEVGSGKTTVCRHLADRLHPGLYRVHYVSLTTGNVLDIYKAIAWELGLTVERSRSSAHHAIRTEISRLAKEARQLPVLVIDEAHHLRNDVLEDLRLLTNFAMDSENRMCLILVGLTELRRRLAMAVHESLSQRLVVRHHLTGLERDEVDAYLTWAAARNDTPLSGGRCSRCCATWTARRRGGLPGVWRERPVCDPPPQPPAHGGPRTGLRGLNRFLFLPIL